MTANPFTICILCCIFWLLSATAPVSGQVNQPPAANDALEAFLLQNGLTRLLITHREVQLEQGIGDRAQAIEKLQQSYSQELFRQIEDAVWSQKLLVKAKSHLAAHPNQKSERLRLAVAHRTVELLRRRYLTGAELTKPNVDEIIEEINLLQRGVKQQIDNLDRLSALQQTEIGDQRRLNQLRQQFGHGEYLLGWSHFLKSAASVQHSKPVLRDAEAYFRSYLELDPHANLTKFSPERFGQKSRFQMLAIVGLGAVMHGIGSEQQSLHCFQMAQHNARDGSNAERAVKTITQWKFAGFLRDRRSQAARMLEENPRLLHDEGLIGAILNQSDSADGLVEQALAGLTLGRDPDRLRAALKTFPDAFSEHSVLGHWIRGYLLLDDFQNEREQASLKQATDELGAAAKKLDPQMSAEIRGHCRFLLGSCRYLNKNYADAAREFLAAAELLRWSALIPELAAESAYRALQALRLVSGDQEANRKSIAQWLNVNFPASPFTKLTNFDADQERREGLSDAEAVTYLSNLRSNESSNLIRSAAAVELARRYRQSTDLSADEFGKYVQEIQIDDRISADAKIQTNYDYVSKLLSQPNPARFDKAIENALVSVKRLINDASQTPPKKIEAAKYLYFQSLVLRTLQPENHRLADEYFEQIKQLNHSSTWTVAAALEIAQVFENAQAKTNVDGRVYGDQMIRVYEFLSQQSTLLKSSNEKVVSLRLARLYIADDRLLEAEALVQGAKQDPLWLPIRANLAKQKRDWRRSASLWQELEKQISAGTDAWLDARLKRLLVLHQFDERAATELLTRTIALNPNMRPTFATRFRQLADQWGLR